MEVSGVSLHESREWEMNEVANKEILQAYYVDSIKGNGTNLGVVYGRG